MNPTALCLSTTQSIVCLLDKEEKKMVFATGRNLVISGKHEAPLWDFFWLENGFSHNSSVGHLCNGSCVSVFVYCSYAHIYVHVVDLAGGWPYFLLNWSNWRSTHQQSWVAKHSANDWCHSWYRYTCNEWLVYVWCHFWCLAKCLATQYCYSCALKICKVITCHIFVTCEYVFVKKLTFEV